MTAFRLAAILTTASLIAAQNPSDAAMERPHDLMVGDAAPALAIDTWVKGEPVTSFASDKVYVVEFWATWCGPCIAGMPHLSELQAEYADKGVEIIGVNIWDEPEKVQPFMDNTVKQPTLKDDTAKQPGKTGNELMGYTVAIETKDDPDEIRNGVMAKTWMAAAGRNGIPCAFIVDRTGKIAYIGHPMGMDSTLEQVVAGEFDLAQASQTYLTQVVNAKLVQEKLGKYNSLFREGKFDEAYPLGHELVKGLLKDNPNALNSLAWYIVDPDKKPAKQDLELALAAAKRAVEITESKNPMVLDTLATVHFARNEFEQAVKVQRSGIKLADGNLADEMKGRLEEFERALATAEASLKTDKVKKSDTDK